MLLRKKICTHVRSLKEKLYVTQEKWNIKGISIMYTCSKINFPQGYCLFFVPFCSNIPTTVLNNLKRFSLLYIIFENIIIEI